MFYVNVIDQVYSDRVCESDLPFHTLDKTQTNAKHISLASPVFYPLMKLEETKRNIQTVAFKWFMKPEDKAVVM